MNGNFILYLASTGHFTFSIRAARSGSKVEESVLRRFRRFRRFTRWRIGCGSDVPSPSATLELELASPIASQWKFKEVCHNYSVSRIWINKVSWLFLSRIRPLLNWEWFFEAAGAVFKRLPFINHKIKLFINRFWIKISPSQIIYWSPNQRKYNQIELF